MSEFELLVEKTVLQVLEKQGGDEFPVLLSPREIEQLSNGKISKQTIYDLAKKADANGFPLVRFGNRDVKVLKDDFVKWMRNGGCPLEDEE